MGTYPKYTKNGQHQMLLFLMALMAFEVFGETPLMQPD